MTRKQYYIMLLRWTDQGIRNFKDTTRRADAAKSEAEKIGGKLTVYWTFGEYDAVCILEAPNDEAAMEFGLKVGSLGNVRTTTLRAFTEEEIAGVVEKAGLSILWHLSFNKCLFTEDRAALESCCSSF